MFKSLPATTAGKAQQGKKEKEKTKPKKEELVGEKINAWERSDVPAQGYVPLLTAILIFTKMREKHKPRVMSKINEPTI